MYEYMTWMMWVVGWFVVANLLDAKQANRNLRDWVQDLQKTVNNQGFEINRLKERK